MPPDNQDHYQILGVSREAPEREIKEAFRALARDLHPDRVKGASPEEQHKATARMALVSKAYNVLKDKQKRAEYDAELKGRPAGAASVQAPSQPGQAAAAPAKPRPSAPAPEAPSPSNNANSAAAIAQRKTMAQKAFVRGMQCFREEKFKEAVSFFDVAAKNDPDSEAQYHLKLAQSLVRSRGSFTRALEAAQKACELDPYKVEFKLVLAEVNEAAGVISKAKEAYQEVLQWDPTNERAKLALSLIEQQEGGGKGALMRKIKGLFAKKK